MREILLPLFAMLAFGTIAGAQPTITSASTPQSGETYTYYRSGALTPGAAGANVTWDFSAITPTANGPANYIACSAAPNCAQNPGTTVVLDNGGSYVYLIQNATTQSWKGVSAGGTNISYSDPEEILHFPITYNNTFNDNFSATFVSGVTFTRSGTVAIVADGWGTLKLPTGTFSNVLRVKRTVTYTDVSAGFPTINYVLVSYSWYSPSKRELLLNGSKLSINGSASSDISTYTNQTPTGIGDAGQEDSRITVSPNPSAGDIILAAPVDAVVKGVSVCDLTGKAVLSFSEQQLPAPGKSTSLPTAALPRGLYILHVLLDGGKREAQKILLN